MTTIEHAETDEQIAATFAVMQQLRPHLEQSQYVPTIRSLMASDGLRVLALSDEGAVKAVAAYRVMNMLYCGRLLYIDDLVADGQARSRGHGAQLIAALRRIGRELGCSEIQLISRTTREQAHRFYFREGFGMECFHFRTKLET
ncbi:MULTISPECIES: GNAT family N-acetyltransferase [Rhodanobacter]|uniref:GNAT family N-acetyltransferase n=1 Tax=Rhodanobacter TaxID=75309 RepID=UPI0003FC8CCE|nr:MULTISPECIES: GNAT family N-acetyltransferase [Rhodanobacter]KZC20933.1 GCN5 family acetyltransferase [Rhodanobacter denitrificans]UJJ51053.1 GNAT family N-acetyltransferase [Rhodanobacter denitrificans]UJM93800.1 GNAT family N-acetyltransferase [Rhodanobacter denitrificans]UJM97331.1 GNAT family N-acetyltransferase [Rhodanobacter denitrificans]UJN23254.1 GNAT family N-acetyltransferase [Rhodanobacter denitrificans]